MKVLPFNLIERDVYTDIISTDNLDSEAEASADLILRA